jgi:hypothetical protein
MRRLARASLIARDTRRCLGLGYRMISSGVAGCGYAGPRNGEDAAAVRPCDGKGVAASQSGN